MQEQVLRALVEDVRAGRLARRAFIERMVGLGLGAPLASMMLAGAGIAQAQPASSYKPARRGGGGALKLLFWQGPTLLNPHFGTGAKDLEGSRFDRRSVQEFVYGRAGAATSNVLNNPSRYNSPNTKDVLSVDKANALLDGAGWSRGSDGIREKGGRKLKLVFQTSINSVRQKVQSIYKQSCGKAGIELELKGVTAAVFFSSDVANPDTYGKFLADLQMYAVAGRGPDPDIFMQWWVSWQAASKANKWLGLNRGRWRSDEYDALYRASEYELDPIKRAALLIAMNDLVCNDYAVIPVVYRPSVHGYARNLVAPVSGWDNALSGMHDWYREGF